MVLTKLEVGYIVEDESKKNTYKIIQKLGGGGNGIAYLVQCIRGELIGNFFTFKLLNRMDGDGKYRFRDEIKFIKDNKHPAILMHYDEGVYNGHPFLVTEYLKHDLTDILNSINLKDALMYSVQLLSALNYLQKNNYVHRDIKPKNIFLDNSYAVLGDFGLIKSLNDKTKDDVGYLRDAMPREYRTPQLISYMNGGKLSIKSDVFQMGLVLYEMFTKQRILSKKGDAKAPLTQKSFADKRPIKSKKYGSRIQGLLNKMITLDENEMYTAEQLLEGFQGVLSEYFVDLREIEFKVID